jgi:hypothetical protein
VANATPVDGRELGLQLGGVALFSAASLAVAVALLERKDF